jgi:rSAM/selenodomain-associated transferase 2
MISIIIPTYNEAGYLAATLAAIRRTKRRPEVIVVDAGSGDGTPDLAREDGARVLFSARRQRAFQMNFAARQASGRVLLFLHADTCLPPSALNQIDLAIARKGIVGGGFTRRYDAGSWFLRATCLLAGWRTRWTGWFLGDQAIFVRRAVFAELGGFRDLDLFEDLDFSRRMARTGKVVTLTPPVISSSRRFKFHGEVRTTLSDLRLTCSYLKGADPHTLAKHRRGMGILAHEESGMGIPAHEHGLEARHVMPTPSANVTAFAGPLASRGDTHSMGKDAHATRT